MSKLFLIDAYALIYRSYYAFIKSPRINSKGVNTSAILGFCNTLHEVLQKEKPDYLAVAFDPHGPTFRSDIFEEYKAQREKTPEDILISVPIIKNILKAMNIPILIADGYEADDIIGTLATQIQVDGLETYMFTPDKDYGQLVRENVKIYRPRFGGGYEIQGVKEITDKYQLKSPEQVIDILALMGDSADNFPGCPGVGEKTAIRLINEFGSVDEIINNTNRLKGALKNKIEEHIDDIKMSKFLATIKTDVPIEYDLEKMKVTSPDETQLRKIFNELEFKTLAEKFLGGEKKVVKKLPSQPDLFGFFQDNDQETEKKSSFESLKTLKHNYQLIENKEDIQKLYDFLLTKKILSLDTETTSTHPIDAELVGLSFAVNEFEAFYVPIPKEREKAQEIVEIFRPLYENDQILKIGQNIKYDFEVLCNYNIRLAGKMWDTMIAHYLIQPEYRHNMDDMAEAYLNYKTIHIDEL